MSEAQLRERMEAVQALAQGVLREPEIIDLGHTRPAETIEHSLHPVRSTARSKLLRTIVEADEAGSAIIFTRTKQRAKQVARQLGCHESAVSRWEGGSRFPTGVDLIALADLFGVSADDLLGRGRQHARAGAALVDMQLLQRLASAASTEEFERLVRANQDQAVWLPVPDGAVLMPVTEAMRLAREVAERFSDSSLVDRLFRPRG